MYIQLYRIKAYPQYTACTAPLVCNTRVFLYNAHEFWCNMQLYKKFFSLAEKKQHTYFYIVHFFVSLKNGVRNVYVCHY